MGGEAGANGASTLTKSWKERSSRPSGAYVSGFLFFAFSFLLL